MVQALSRNPQQAVQMAMRSAGIEPGQGKKELSGAQVQALAQHLAELPPVQKKWATEGLQKAFQTDAFEVNAKSKATFATLIGVPVERLAHKGDHDQRSGELRNVMSTAVSAKGKPGRLTGPQMEKLVNASAGLPPEMQALVFNSLANNSKLGRIEMDTKARKPFMRQMMQIAKESALPAFLNEVESSISPKNDSISQLLSSNMCFEDLVAAFMMLVAGSLQDDVKEKMRELEASRRSEDRKGVFNKATNALANKLGVTQSNIDVIEDVPAQAQGTQPGLTPEQVAQTRTTLEAVVQSTHHHLTDDGVIDATEANKIVEKLSRLDGPVADLVASSLLSAFRRSGLIATEGAGPMVEWCKGRLGDDVDVSPLPAGEPGKMESDVAKSLSESGKLEDKIAGFVVDALLSSDKSLKEKMKAFKPIRKDMLSYPASAAAMKDVEQKVAQSGVAEKLASEIGPKDKPGILERAGDAVKDAGGAVKDVILDVAQEALAPEPEKSRQMLMQELQTLMQQFSQVMQAMSNVMNSMHQTTMNSVRNIR